MIVGQRWKNILGSPGASYSTHIVPEMDGNFRDGGTGAILLGTVLKYRDIDPNEGIDLYMSDASQWIVEENLKGLVNRILLLAGDLVRHASDDIGREMEKISFGKQQA
jgi:hypothetical protein